MFTLFRPPRATPTQPRQYNKRKGITRGTPEHWRARTVTMPDADWDELCVLAQAKGTSATALMQRVLHQYLVAQRKTPAGQKRRQEARKAQAAALPPDAPLAALLGGKGGA